MRQPPSGGCVLKPLHASIQQKTGSQPPSGGCVLKRRRIGRRLPPHPPAAFGRLCVETASVACGGSAICQPPSGGCVLKLCVCFGGHPPYRAQPPSGGCVLKQAILTAPLVNLNPAAFGRLCVETAFICPNEFAVWPAAFGRLCVETKRLRLLIMAKQSSRLRAAVC